jgi:hypothetical protein
MMKFNLIKYYKSLEPNGLDLNIWKKYKELSNHY